MAMILAKISGSPVVPTPQVLPLPPDDGSLRIDEQDEERVRMGLQRRAKAAEGIVSTPASRDGPPQSTRPGELA